MQQRRFRYKLYLADEAGGYSSYEPLRVEILGDTLKIGKRLTVRLAEIASCQLRPIGRGKSEYIELVVCSPDLNRGVPTPVYLIHQHFLSGFTKSNRMEQFVADLAPFIAGNDINQLVEAAAQAVEDTPDGHIQVGYVFNCSFVIACYRKTWFAFDAPKKIMFKTYTLIFFGAIVNVIGVLLVAVPFDNWSMSKNIEIVGGSRMHRLAVYFSSLCIPAAFWTYLLTR